MSNSASNLPAKAQKFSAWDIFATFGVYALLIFMALFRPDAHRPIIGRVL